MTFKKGLAYFVSILLVFMLVFAGTAYVRDPQVDLSKYDNVIPSYKEKIQELRVATRLVSGYMLGLRVQEGLDRLKALASAEGNISTPAKTVLFYYYSQPERYKCEFIESCPEMRKLISQKRSEKAFYWARQMETKEKAVALASLLRDTRIAPIATESDRIALMASTEEGGFSGAKAATALAFHYLDKRYFKDDMIAESGLWLDRAAEIDDEL